MLKIVVTINETKSVPVIVRPTTSGGQSINFNSKPNDLNETLKSLGYEQVSLKELLPKYKKVTKELLKPDQHGEVPCCSICQEVYKENEYSRKLKCGHIFHKKCVDRWLKKNPSCPVCRHDLL